MLYIYIYICVFTIYVHSLLRLAYCLSPIADCILPRLAIGLLLRTHAHTEFFRRDRCRRPGARAVCGVAEWGDRTGRATAAAAVGPWPSEGEGGGGWIGVGTHRNTRQSPGILNKSSNFELIKSWVNRIICQYLEITSHILQNNPP